MTKVRKAFVSEFYIQVFDSADNHIVGIAMNACGMPAQEFFYYEICGVPNLWRCTKTQARSFKKRLPDVHIFRRQVGPKGASELKDVTAELF